MFMHQTSKIDYTQVAFVVMLMAAAFIVPTDVLATGGSASGTSGTVYKSPGAQQGNLEGTICQVIGELRGPIARGVAAIGVIILGFTLFLGKISWGVAIALAIGVGAVFGAPQIVGLLGDGVESCPDLAAGSG